MYCIWLTFDSSNLSKIIIKLAQKYDGPVFQPHCTLICKTDVSLSKIKSTIINLNCDFDLSKIHTKKIVYSDNLWRTLFIEIIEKQLLTGWHNNLCDLLSINPDKDFLPHISLMYNSISVKEKRIIFNRIQLKPVYKIQSIQIVDCSGKVESWKPVFELQI